MRWEFGRYLSTLGRQQDWKGGSVEIFYPAANWENLSAIRVPLVSFIILYTWRMFEKFLED